MQSLAIIVDNFQALNIVAKLSTLDHLRGVFNTLLNMAVYDILCTSFVMASFLGFHNNEDAGIKKIGAANSGEI